MNQMEKLQVLLPHWIDHNKGHAEECRKWLADLETDNVHTHLTEALDAMALVGKHLEEALHAAGGPKESHGHGHQHHSSE